MRILLNFSHESTLELLSELEHDFYIPHNQANWNETAEEDFLEFHPSGVPDNLHYDETPDDPDIVVKGDECDIYPMLVEPYGSPHPTAINMYHYETTLVLRPPPTKRWVLVGKGVDTDRFSGWRGDLDGPIVTVVNLNKPVRVEKNFRGDQFKRMRKEFGEDFKVYGRGEPCDEFIPHEKIHEKLREASIYVEFKNRQGSSALVEAMSVGCPIVMGPSVINDFITPNYNGVTSENMVESVHRLLNNRELCEFLGRNARRKAKGKYNKDEFLTKWDNTFKIAKMMKEGGKL